YAHGAALLAATWFETGASVELISGVDVDYADELFARGELTAVFAPPTVLAKLTQGTRHTRIDGIKCIFCGTATLQPALYRAAAALFGPVIRVTRSEEHTSELQSRGHLVCRLLLEKKNKNKI